MTERKTTSKNPTKQRTRKPSVGRGGVPTPPGFEAHPERRHNGAWKKEETARWKFEQIIKMGMEELDAIIDGDNTAEFERTCATVVKKMRVMAASSVSPADLEKVLSMLERLTNQVYGMPKQKVEQTNIELTPILPKPKKRGRK